MPHYRYKLARRLIKRAFKWRGSLLCIYNDEDSFVSEFREKIIKTSKEEFIANCDEIIKKMYEILNNPQRFKRKA